jgi:hypothetical protein
MPAVIPFIPLISAGVMGGTAVAGGVMASRANSRAAQQAQSGTDAQLAFMREQARMDEQRFQQQRVDEVAQWNANQARRAPYRQASLSILARRMGQPELENPAPQTRPPMTPTQPPPRQVPVATQMGAGRSVVDTMANGQRQTLADLARRRTR